MGTSRSISSVERITSGSMTSPGLFLGDAGEPKNTPTSRRPVRGDDRWHADQDVGEKRVTRPAAAVFDEVDRRRDTDRHRQQRRDAVTMRLPMMR